MCHPVNTDHDRSQLFTIAVMVLCLILVTAMVLLAILKPGDTSTGTLILGTVGPIITIFVAAAIREGHKAMNSRLSQLLETTSTSAHAAGMLQEKNEAIERHTRGAA